MSSPADSPWPRFSHDPRRDEFGGLRAGDRDRDVVLDVLSAGYAEGRLDREEYDERAEAVASARTLGELPALIRDLVVDLPLDDERRQLALSTPDELRAKAVQRYEAERRQAYSGLLIPSLICFVIWFATGFGGEGWQAQFPWPLFVVLGTGINVVRVLVHREDLIAEQQRKLEKKQRKALEPPKSDKPDAE